MKKVILFLMLSILVFPLTAEENDGADPILLLNIGRQVRLETVSGASFQGVVYEVTDEFILLQDRNGQILTLVKTEIEGVTLIAADADKKAYYQDSAANRLLVMPTGFPMEPGEFHIADQEIAAVTMSYGVTSNFSLWGGVSVPGALVSARYTMETGDRTALSIGSFGGISWIEFTGILIPYTVFSIGEPENNFSVGTGALFSFDDEEFAMNAAVLTLGGKWVLSDTTAIVTENWFIWGERTVWSDWVEGEDSEIVQDGWDPVPIISVPGIAFRIAGAKFSWDIGAVVPVIINKDNNGYSVDGLGGDWAFIPIPLISLTYRID